METTSTKVSTPKVQGVSFSASAGLKSALANYPRVLARPIVRTAMETETVDLPIRTLKPKAPEPIRIDVANQQRLIEGTRRLALAFGAETSPTLIANQILEETAERWFQEKEALARPAAEKPAKKAKARE